MATGVVRTVDRRRRSGAITPDDGGPDLDVDVRRIVATETRVLEVGARVEYDVVLDAGRPVAENIKRR